jgi:hypothetical protein
MSTAIIETPRAIEPDVVVEQLRVYQAQTNQSLSQIARKVGREPRTLMRFALGRDYGKNGDGHVVAQLVAELMAREPVLLPELPGRLYESETTRAIDGLIEFCREGGWGTLYGPAGAQKSFPLEYRAAEAARRPEPDLILVRAEADMTPRELLGRIAQGARSGYAQSKEGIRQLLFQAVRRRKANLVLVIDEADLLYPREDTIETLRGLGDELPCSGGLRPSNGAHRAPLQQAGLGILVAGNERVLKLFDPRRGIYFGGWRSRIGQKRVQAVHPTRELAEAMLEGELGAMPQAAMDKAIEKSMSTDPVDGAKYIDLRFLKQQVEFLRRRMRKAN